MLRAATRSALAVACCVGLGGFAGTGTAAAGDVPAPLPAVTPGAASPGGASAVAPELATPARGVRIEVADEGSGVPADAVERIFDRFCRVETGPRPGSGGAGLGLAIARSIVELHGGSIRAEPRAPAGCRIIVDLPG